MKCTPKCEWQIQPPWGELSLTSWGNPRAPPVFLAHGRQDCAATFQPLLELLGPEEFYYVSIDMPGSGNSTPFPVAEPLHPRNNATVTTGNTMTTTICRSSQKRKHGMKLTKIPDDSIVCNDHGGRRCSFAKPVYPTDRVFFIRGYKKPIIKRYLQNRLARGWSVWYWFKWGQMVEMVAENQDDRVSEISALSPITEYTVESDSNSPSECELIECPHLPEGLLRDLHDFYKYRQMSNYAERPPAVPYVNDVTQSPYLTAQNWDSPLIYETSPQQYSYISEIHNYARRPVANPWANDTELSPLRQNPQPYDMPSMSDLIPQRDTNAPVSKPYNPEYTTRTTSILSPEESSNYGNVALPGLYTPIGTAPGYDYEYMYPDRDSPELDQYRPNCLLPWTYSNPFTPISYDRFVPCPVLSNGLPCCFVYDAENPQESTPSEEQNQNNEDLNRTTEGVKIMRFHFVAAMEAAIEHLGWDKFIFIGHSMGSEIGLFYNSVNPGKITKMILCDPEPTFRRLQVRDLPRYQTTFYDNYYSNYWKDNFHYRTYTITEAKQALMRARNLTEEKASIILNSSLKHVHDDQYRFTWDRRLKLPAPQNYPNSYYFAIFSNMPSTLVISASDSLREQSTSGSLELLNMLSSLENFNHVTVEGSHDVHLTNPERLASHVIKFLKVEPKVNSKL